MDTSINVLTQHKKSYKRKYRRLSQTTQRLNTSPIQAYSEKHTANKLLKKNWILTTPTVQNTIFFALERRFLFS